MTSPRWRGAGLGAAFGAALVSVSVALSRLAGADTNVVQQLAEAIRDATPGPLATKLVHLVGHADKPLLLSGVVVGIVVVCAAIGWFLPLPRALREIPGRRALLALCGVVGVSAVVAAASGFANKDRRKVQDERAALDLPVDAGVVPVGADFKLDGLTPWRVPNGDFYRIDTALVVPAVAADDWRLRIHGMVDHELTLTYDDLRNAELTQAWMTLACVSNGVGGDLIGNAFWSGVRIADVLAQCGVHPDADAILQTSYDGWTCGTPIEAVTDDRNAMLAIAMNGKPLPLEHGFPVRMVVPGLFGYVSACKWIVDIEVTRFDRFTAYWTSRGWSERGPINTESRIDVPRGDVDAGDVTFAGVAWAQHTGVERVEVSIDGGSWHTAELGRVPGVDTWVQWRIKTHLKKGRHTAVVRATDRSGQTQTPVVTYPAPDGATGWHKVEFTAN